jgi:retinol dehydrogenase 12
MVCVITGATSGIGFAIAKKLAGRNTELILIARDKQKADRVTEELKKEAPNLAITYYVADLSSQRQLRTVGEAIKAKHLVIDVLINNAAMVPSQHEFTENKIEKQFAVNHLAYFLLTHLLYASIARSENGRIINIGSDSHRNGKIYFDNINLNGEYNPLKAYAQSKLANILFTYELHRIKKEPHVSVYCVSPGLVKTDIGVKHTGLFHSLLWKLRRLGGKLPEQAAETPIYLATAQEVAQKSGLYWQDCKPKPSSSHSMDSKLAQRLWKLSETMCGIKDFF